MLEQLVVFGLVAACAVYSVWSLLPGTLKRRLSAKSNGVLPAGQGGCGAGCDSCASPAPGSNKAAFQPAPQPVHWHGRQPGSGRPGGP